jgi:microcin C transport system substrate-binding protein
MRGLLLLLACAFLCPAAWSAHGYALWDDLKYPAGFTAFDYARVDAPKGGELRLVSNQRYSTFDKYNPFTIKGAPPAYLATLLFDSLLTARWTRPHRATACWPRT